MRVRFYVGNLPYDLSEEALTDSLVFQGIGVLNLRIVADKDTGASKGFGFFETEDFPEAVLEKTKAMDVSGRRLRVSVAEKQPKPRSQTRPD